MNIWYYGMYYDYTIVKNIKVGDIIRWYKHDFIILSIQEYEYNANQNNDNLIKALKPVTGYEIFTTNDNGFSLIVAYNSSNWELTLQDWTNETELKKYQYKLV